jgi:hypothetical protein
MYQSTGLSLGLGLLIFEARPKPAAPLVRVRLGLGLNGLGLVGSGLEAQPSTSLLAKMIFHNSQTDALVPGQTDLSDCEFTGNIDGQNSPPKLKQNHCWPPFCFEHMILYNTYLKLCPIFQMSYNIDELRLIISMNLFPFY